MDLEGRVIQFIGETSGTSRTGNPWKKKEWLVETYGQFPKKVKVQCFGDRADSMNLEPGKDYILSIDLESREYNGRWYTDVSVFRYQENHNAPGGLNQGINQNPVGQDTFNQPPYPGQPPMGTTSFSVSVEESDEDLPF